MDRTQRLLAAIMLVSVATAACSAAAQPSWTWAPDDGTGARQTGTPRPTEAPAGSASPAGGDPSSDPNAGGDPSPDANAGTTAATYYPRDPRAPARLAGTTHDIDLVVEERNNTVADGFVRQVWTFGGTVPGPVIRVQVGDTIRIHLINRPATPLRAVAIGHPPVNNASHSVGFHASMVAPNDQMTSIKPGEEKTVEFKAEYAGVWMYHCETEPVLQHIANGMYGMVIVEPEGGLGRIDQEFFFVQSEWYLGGGNPLRPPTPSLAKAAAAAPAPDFVVFNGIADQYLDHPIQVETGKRVRAFILDAGPNIDSSFHIEGTIFDRVIKEGIELKVGNEGSWGSQAVDLSPGQGAIVEFTMAEDGLYPIVTHAFNFVGRGALGLFQAGDGDPPN